MSSLFPHLGDALRLFLFRRLRGGGKQTATRRPCVVCREVMADSVSMLAPTDTLGKLETAMGKMAALGSNLSSRPEGRGSSPSPPGVGVCPLIEFSDGCVSVRTESSTQFFPLVTALTTVTGGRCKRVNEPFVLRTVWIHQPLAPQVSASLSSSLGKQRDATGAASG